MLYSVVTEDIRTSLPLVVDYGGGGSGIGHSDLAGLGISKELGGWDFPRGHLRILTKYYIISGYSITGYATYTMYICCMYVVRKGR